MLDLGDIEIEIPTKPKKQKSISTSDKIEIPQDIIDTISGSISSEDSENE